MATSNLAIEYLNRKGETIWDYDGLCVELVDGMMHWLGEDTIEILYIKPTDWAKTLVLVRPHDHEEFNWSYHAVSVIDGFVHDAWAPEVILPPEEYVDKVFEDQDAEFYIV